MHLSIKLFDHVSNNNCKFNNNLKLLEMKIVVKYRILIQNSKIQI